MFNLLRDIFAGPGPVIIGPPGVPEINQQPYDPGMVHPVKFRFRGYAWF